MVYLQINSHVDRKVLKWNQKQIFCKVSQTIFYVRPHQKKISRYWLGERIILAAWLSSGCKLCINDKAIDYELAFLWVLHFVRILKLDYKPLPKKQKKMML